MKNKYIVIAVIFGAGIGLCIGILSNSIAIGLTLGSGAGLVFGAAHETGIEKEQKR